MPMYCILELFGGNHISHQCVGKHMEDNIFRDVPIHGTKL